MKTNIFAHGFKDGRAVSFGASRKGRIWSHEEAHDIHNWVTWARKVGPAIIDESIALESVMSGFLLPEPAKERPPYVPLAIEWPYELVATISENRKLVYEEQGFPLLDCEIRLTEHKPTGPLAFELVAPAWNLGFEFEFQDDEPPVIRLTTNDGTVETPKGTMRGSSFLTRHGLLVTFQDEIVLVEQGFMLRPDREKRLLPADAVELVDWSGIDIKRESQGPERDPHTVQYRAIESLSAEGEWEIVLDDDGTGELADIVLMRRGDEDLEVVLVHCKYSSEPKPGARIEDLYDVCGQAMKTNRAKSVPDLLARRLLRRETMRQRKGQSGLVVGDIDTLTSIVREARFRKLRATIVIVQPGISKTVISEDMRAMLGGVERYLADTHGMALRVIGSS